MGRLYKVGLESEWGSLRVGFGIAVDCGLLTKSTHAKTSKASAQGTSVSSK